MSVGLVLVLAACGSVRVVDKTQYGGILALQGEPGKAMEAAAKEMSAHCGGPGSYQVVRENEVPVGTDTYVREDTASDTKTSRSGRRSSTDTTTTGTTSTRTKTERRIEYRCNNAPPEAAPPPPPEGAPPPPEEGAPPPPPPAPGY
jgi:hypothetical protein